LPPSVRATLWRVICCEQPAAHPVSPTPTQFVDALLNDLCAFSESLAECRDGFQSPDRREVLHRLLSPFDLLLGASGSILEVGTGALIA
jgi:hypothetical protein